MFKKLILALIAIAIVVLGVLIHQQNKTLNKYNHEKEIMKDESKKTFEDIISHSEVNAYEEKTKQKIDSFLKGEYKDDSPNEEGSAYNVLRGLFTVAGHKIVLTEDSSKKDILDYYTPFEYSISNFSAKKEGDKTHVIFNIKTTYDGKKINEKNDLMKLTFDHNDKLIGGELYAK
ncbi:MULTISPECIES: hypothetical protein [Staphylococcus]|uniref:hypothetical protein n=1 Tax=Staphylococcus TaxID=1279 RepID=UPI000D0255F7|nr:MULTISPECIES: hypothetical protein [Staphylococcus]MDT0694140.1 hypothetical protein [Staphylococcus chromogenes]HDK8139686.1 hypothetical protein [Staphylococcus aureus]